MPKPCPIKRVMQSLVRSLKVHCVLVRQYHPLHLIYFLGERITFLAKSFAIGEKTYVARNSSCGHKQVSQEMMVNPFIKTGTKVSVYLLAVQ